MKKTYKLQKYDWIVEVVWYLEALDKTNVEAIKKLLVDSGCQLAQLSHIMEIIESDNVNCAAIYSNHSTRKSVMIIGPFTSDYELVNSITHEIMHLSRHIKNCGNSETLATDLGNLAGDIYKDIIYHK